MKILIVDDSDFSTLFIEAIVRRFGYYTLTAVNGKDAILKVKQNEPDLIILDIIMPIMNGYEFLKELNKNYSDIPVIITSELSSKKDIDKAKKIKNNIEYLPKPVEPMELQLKVGQLLENNKILKSNNIKYTV